VPTHPAPAKVNLRLAVLAREESGYHQIETLFCALELADEIDIDVAAEADGVRLHVEGADLGAAEENLAYRAARAFFAAAGRPARARITLRKRIPHGAGLGGGSSDAATTLRALNAALDDPLSPGDLLRIAATLGSDVPFFLAGSPFALAWGRGERLLPLPPPPSRPVLVVAPARAIATADAYRWLARQRAGSDAALVPITHDITAWTDWAEIAARAENDFERVVFEKLPALAALRDALAAAGARPALLSGSGSALFGVFASDDALPGARARISALDPDARVFMTRTAAAPLLAPPPRR
jgi:4-diphosphocytidyl-2-C-methyl-D-erythritol kinase